MSKLKPTQFVLGRDNKNDIWKLDHFSHCYNNESPYYCINSYYQYCIPYEGNEWLLDEAYETEIAYEDGDLILVRDDLDAAWLAVRFSYIDAGGVLMAYSLNCDYREDKRVTHPWTYHRKFHKDLIGTITED